MYRTGTQINHDNYPIAHIQLGKGDTVRCEIDFDCAPRTVTFSINGARAASVAWEHGDSAFPAISSEGGTVHSDIKF